MSAVHLQNPGSTRPFLSADIEFWHRALCQQMQREKNVAKKQPQCPREM